LEQVAERVQSPARVAEAEPVAEGPAAKVGDRVVVKSLGMEGRVIAVQAGEADIEVRGKRMRARLPELQVVGRAAEAEPSKVNVHLMVAARDGAATTEINVIGCSVEEALGRVERFLDQLLLSDERQIRIIHGFGTGQLRRAIGEFLDRHPLVATHQAAPQEHGGGGVTVAELKD
jgi:DNA mismatch repair protein MutS2